MAVWNIAVVREIHPDLHRRPEGDAQGWSSFRSILGAILSLPITYARMSKNSFLAALGYGYVYFFRGTPLLAQTFLIYYGVGSFRPQLEAIGLWSFFREAWYCAILAFTLNTAAYQAEILRGAIRSVPRGQWEGAASLGLHKLQTLPEK